MPTQEDLLSKLKDAEEEEANARLDVNAIKFQLMNAETRLVGAKFSKDKIKEELSVFRRRNGIE